MVGNAMKCPMTDWVINANLLKSNFTKIYISTTFNEILQLTINKVIKKIHSLIPNYDYATNPGKVQ